MGGDEPSDMLEALKAAAPVLSGDRSADTLRLLSSGAVDLEHVSVICLEPIRQRLGPRWERKRETIWTHVLAFMKRFFGPADLILQLDSLNVLIAQPEISPAAGRSRAVQAAAELMTFFLGDASASTVDVRLVASVDDGGVACAKMTAQQLEPLLLAAGADVAGPARSGAFPVLTPLGRKLRVRVDLRRVWSLKGSPRLVGYYGHTTVIDAAAGEALDERGRAALLPSELCALDVELLREALQLRAAAPSLFGGLVLPVSYITIANSQTRYELLKAVRELPASSRRSFAWEIVDLDAGIPSGKLAEVVAMIRNHCRGVICRLPLTPENAEKAAAAGATLSVGPPELDYTEHQLLKQEKKVAAVVQRSRVLNLHGIPQPLAPVAGFIGVTHCTFEAKREAPARDPF